MHEHVGGGALRRLGSISIPYSLHFSNTKLILGLDEVHILSQTSHHKWLKTS